MAVTIPFTAEEEAKLLAFAAGRGVSPHDLVKGLSTRPETEEKFSEWKRLVAMHEVSGLKVHPSGVRIRSHTLMMGSGRPPPIDRPVTRELVPKRNLGNLYWDLISLARNPSRVLPETTARRCRPSNPGAR